MIRTIAVTLAMFAALPARAQAPVDHPILPCPGHFVAIRHSEVQPGKWAIFEQAVHDQNAWYASRHIATSSRIARIIEGDPKTGARSYSASSALTVTTYADPLAERTLVHDAAWEKFVGEYKASSTIRDEYRACLPDAPQP